MSSAKEIWDTLALAHEGSKEEKEKPHVHLGRFRFFKFIF